MCKHIGREGIIPVQVYSSGTPSLSVPAYIAVRTYIGTCNVHLRVKASEDQSVCCATYYGSAVNKNVVLLIKKLKRYSISIAAM